MDNPIRKVSIRLPKPLPRHLKDDQVGKLLSVITDLRDRAMFMLMLRYGLRVEEVSRLTLDAIELSRNRLFVTNGKGRKDRVVYLSKDASTALNAYLRMGSSKVRQVFLVQKGPLTGTPISVRGILKNQVLCPAEQGEGVVSQSPSHHGNTASQCRRRSLDDPGPSRSYPYHHYPALLQSLEYQGPEGLIHCYRDHHAEKPTEGRRDGSRMDIWERESVCHTNPPLRRRRMMLTRPIRSPNIERKCFKTDMKKCMRKTGCN
jgi:integrase